MKMRFWQKTYIFTLILFLFCINIGVLSLTVYTHSKNVQSAEATASAEQYYVAMSFERDYSDLMEMNENASPTLLMQTFGSHYKSKGIMLSFNKNGSTLYKNYTESIESPTDSLLHTEINGDRHIIISASVCNGEYELVFGKNVSSVDDEFKSLMITYVITALAVSIILAVCLYFILKKLSTPLERLRNTTEIIESGDFSVRATEQGSDEFTLLARSFNAMLDKINEQFETLERDAKRKQMLVDNMAHELRTPLTSIHGYAEFLEKAATTEEKRIIAAKYIMSESERLQKISEILLDSAYIRGNELKKDENDIALILYDVSEKLQFKAKDFNAEIILDTEKTIVSYDALGIARLIYQLPTTLCETYLKEVFKLGSIESLDQETLFTIQRFFENNLNVSETSRKLFVHRNTLVYRLEKIKKFTGLDLREFDHAIIFKIALMVNKYLKSNPVKY